MQQELSLGEDAQAPKGRPTPKATEPDSTRIDTAAAPDVVEAVERVSATVGGVVLEHDQLPLPDYDHMTLGSLRGRMRSLDLPELVQLRDYEKAHADRLPIVTMLDNRIAKLAADPTAPLSGSAPSSAASAPDKARPGRKGSRGAAVDRRPGAEPADRRRPDQPLAAALERLGQHQPRLARTLRRPSPHPGAASGAPRVGAWAWRTARSRRCPCAPSRGRSSSGSTSSAASGSRARSPS